MEKDLSRAAIWEWMREEPQRARQESACSQHVCFLNTSIPSHKRGPKFIVSAAHYCPGLSDVYLTLQAQGRLLKNMRSFLHWVRNRNHFQGHVWLQNYTEACGKVGETHSLEKPQGVVPCGRAGRLGAAAETPVSPELHRFHIGRSAVKPVGCSPSIPSCGRVCWFI